MKLYHITYLLVLAYLLKCLLEGASLCLHFHTGADYCINLTHTPATANVSSCSPSIYYEPTGCDCNGTTYTRSSINAAAIEALRLASQGETTGEEKYPHVYNDYERFKFSHCAAPYLEFPLERGSSVYDGGSSGSDRVVIGSIAEDYSSAVYCAVVTCDDSGKGFTECADDTMNLRGKGRYEGHGRMDHRHRKLL